MLIRHKIGSAEKVEYKAAQKPFIKLLPLKGAGKLTAADILAVLFIPPKHGGIKGLDEIFTVIF